MQKSLPALLCATLGSLSLPGCGADADIQVTAIPAHTRDLHVIAYAADSQCTGSTDPLCSRLWEADLLPGTTHFPLALPAELKPPVSATVRVEARDGDGCALGRAARTGVLEGTPGLGFQLQPLDTPLCFFWLTQHPAGAGQVRTGLSACGDSGPCPRVVGEYEKGTALSLRAWPDIQAAAFTGWSGACQGGDPGCHLTVGGPVQLSANFARRTGQHGASPRSFIFPSPDPPSASVAFPLAVSYNLAVQGPATFYYTVDGSTPSPGAPGTAAAAGPVMRLATPATVKWFADYGPDYPPEAVQTSTWMQQVVHPVNFDGIAQNVRFSLSGGPIAVATPGTRLDGTLDYQAWRSDSMGSCPGCLLQFAVYVLDQGVGVADNGCIDGVEGWGPFPGRSGQMNFSLRAPVRPGLYYLRAQDLAGYTCSGWMLPNLPNVPGWIVGAIVVE